MSNFSIINVHLQSVRRLQSAVFIKRLNSNTQHSCIIWCNELFLAQTRPADAVRAELAERRGDQLLHEPADAARRRAAAAAARLRRQHLLLPEAHAGRPGGPAPLDEKGI